MGEGGGMVASCRVRGLSLPVACTECWAGVFEAGQAWLVSGQKGRGERGGMR